MGEAPVAEENPWDMVLDYVGLLSDRIEILCQATVYNTHEHQRLLVNIGATTQELANKTVRSLAQDLDVPINIADEGVSFEEGKAQESE